MDSREIEEVEPTILGACLNMEDNDEKREEAMMTSYFVSLWMAHHLLREKMVREGQVWEEGEFRDFRLEVPVTFKWRCLADGWRLGPETQERRFN